MPFGQDSAASNRVEFRVTDLAGRTTDAGYTLPVDSVAPTAAAAAPEITAGAAVTVTWSGGDATSGITGYDLQVRVDAGPWTPWLTGTTATGAVYSGVPGSTVYFRARATDLAGNTGAYRDGMGDARTFVGVTVASLGVGRGWSLVGLPARPVLTVTAEALLQGINEAGGAASEIAAWQDGGWSSHLLGVPANDFPLEAGRGYFVRGTAPASWQFTGFTSTEAMPRTLAAGWNLVSVPMGRGPYTAESLAARMREQGGAPRFVMRWQAGAWARSPGGPAGQRLCHRAGARVLCVLRRGEPVVAVGRRPIRPACQPGLSKWVGAQSHWARGCDRLEPETAPWVPGAGAGASLGRRFNPAYRRGVGLAELLAGCQPARRASQPVGRDWSEPNRWAGTHGPGAARLLSRLARAVALMYTGAPARRRLSGDHTEPAGSDRSEEEECHGTARLL